MNMTFPIRPNFAHKGPKVDLGGISLPSANQRPAFKPVKAVSGVLKALPTRFLEVRNG